MSWGVPAIETMAAFAAVVTAIVVSPGPNLFLLLRNTPAHGRTVGLLNTFGVCSAIMSHAILSLLGISAVILASATLFGVIKLLGAAYLVWLGLRSLRSAMVGTTLPHGRPGSTDPEQGPSHFKAFAQGWTANILNPKPALFYLAAFPQFIDALDGLVLLQGLCLASVHATIAALWYGSVVLSVDRANLWLRRPRVWRAVQSISGLALIGFGIHLALVRAPGSVRTHSPCSTES